MTYILQNLVHRLSKPALLVSLTCCFFFAMQISFAEAATLSTSPKTGVYTVGGVFSVSVVVDTDGKKINASEGTVTFDAQKLSVVSLQKGSVFTLWTVEPSFSNSAGTVTFGGGSPQGYTGRSGTILTIVFRAKSAGNAKVSFTNGSVLAADGLGTNILSGMGGGAYTLAASEVPAEPETIEYIAEPNTPGAPVVTSTSHPDQSGWYTRTTAELSWVMPSGVTGVRTLIDKQSGSIPTKVYDTTISSLSIPELEDGVSYFHIQFRNSEGWGRVTHYRLATDTQKPSSFEIKLPDEYDPSAPEQVLILDGIDEPSGISRYLIAIDGGEPYEYVDEIGSSTVTLPPLQPGQHSVIIEAFDAAGNSIVDTFTFTIVAFDKPQFTEYPAQISSDVIPVIKGLTRPGAEVTITIRRVGGSEKPAEYVLKSDDHGEFVLIPDGSFENGVYELVAVAVDAGGAMSDPSDTIRLAVQDPGFIKIGSFIVNILSILVPLVALALLLVFLVVYFITRIKKIRGVVVTETKEALDVLNREFVALESLLEKHRKSLIDSRKTKKLTQAESDLLEAVKTGMESSRKRVEKEISDVDDIVE